jgi:hypothetical protein
MPPEVNQQTVPLFLRRAAALAEIEAEASSSRGRSKSPKLFISHFALRAGPGRPIRTARSRNPKGILHAEFLHWLAATQSILCADCGKHCYPNCLATPRSSPFWVSAGVAFILIEQRELAIQPTPPSPESSRPINKLGYSSQSTVNPAPMAMERMRLTDISASVRYKKSRPGSLKNHHSTPAVQAGVSAETPGNFLLEWLLPC